MNAHTILPDYVSGHHYTIEEGHYAMGLFGPVPTGVPVCSGCDCAVPDSGLCPHCDVLHIDLAPQWPETLSDPLKGLVA